MKTGTDNARRRGQPEDPLTQIMFAVPVVALPVDAGKQRDRRRDDWRYHGRIFEIAAIMFNGAIEQHRSRKYPATLVEPLSRLQGGAFFNAKYIGPLMHIRARATR